MNRRMAALDEDEMISRAFARMRLSRGHEVQVFAVPAETLSCWQDDPHDTRARTCTDTILADIGMPSLGGLDLADDQEE